MLRNLRSKTLCFFFSALDKLGLSGWFPPTSTTTAPTLTAPETVSPTAAFDVASLVLYGTHAVPVRLKILLDRLFSALREEEVIQILKGYGWSMDDYRRGYMLKVSAFMKDDDES